MATTFRLSALFIATAILSGCNSDSGTLVPDETGTDGGNTTVVMVPATPITLKNAPEKVSSDNAFSFSFFSSLANTKRKTGKGRLTYSFRR